eukprot:1192260-Prorocentrum_minimum.AAC.1
MGWVLRKYAMNPRNRTSIQTISNDAARWDKCPGAVQRFYAIPQVSRRFAMTACDGMGVQVVCDDFMRWRKKEQLLPDEMAKVKVVANLPYNITSDALKRLLPMGDNISDVVVMVQLEAAERFTSASPGDGDYRPISVRVHFYSTPEFVRKVDKSLYYPAPAVDGAIIRFKLKQSNELPQVAGILR